MTWKIVGNEIQHSDGDRWVKIDSYSNDHDFKEELDAMCFILNGLEAMEEDLVKESK